MRVIIAGIFALLSVFLVKKIFIPFFSDFALERFLEITIRKQIEILEFAAIVILAAAYVIEEIKDLIKLLMPSGEGVGPSRSLWMDMLWFFTLIFGSYALYSAVLRAFKL